MTCYKIISGTQNIDPNFPRSYYKIEGRDEWYRSYAEAAEFIQYNFGGIAYASGYPPGGVPTDWPGGPCSLPDGTPGSVIDAQIAAQKAELARAAIADAAAQLAAQTAMLQSKTAVWSSESAYNQEVVETNNEIGTFNTLLGTLTAAPATVSTAAPATVSTSTSSKIGSASLGILAIPLLILIALIFLFRMR